MFNSYFLGIYIGFHGKIFDFILDILTRSWILSWIFSKILARSWQDVEDVERWVLVCDIHLKVQSEQIQEKQGSLRKIGNWFKNRNHFRQNS